MRLEEVANVIDSVEDDKNGLLGEHGEHGCERAVNLGVMRQPGSNTIEVTDEIKRAAADVSKRSCRRRCTLQDPRRPLQEHSRGVPRHPVHHGHHAGAW